MGSCFQGVGAGAGTGDVAVPRAGDRDGYVNRNTEKQRKRDTENE